MNSPNPIPTPAQAAAVLCAEAEPALFEIVAKALTDAQLPSEDVQRIGKCLKTIAFQSFGLGLQTAIAKIVAGARP